MTSLMAWAGIRLLLVFSLFFPLLHSEAAHRPVEIDGAQSVSTLLQITGTGCNLGYKMIGQPYTIPSVLHVWSEGECEDEWFFINTGYWWADWVCTGEDCIEVTAP